MTTHPHNKGFALPAVIFMMVVVTLLIAYMVRIQATQTATSDLRLLGVKAYMAAQAGAQLAAYKVSTGNSCATISGSLSIDGFQVTIGCNSNIYTEGGATLTVFEIAILAASPGAVSDTDYVSRNVTLVLNVET